ncbi:MAG: hypothetical protein KDA87_22745, partial [Planctomycetales bacterium]|nr:hypothetical protein [Planctomycetales bacterium]
MNVSIPDTAMNVGDVVTATITVASDSDNYATNSPSGNVGGFPLSNFQKTNDTTYTAQFTIAEGGTDVAAGSDIPVSVTMTDPGDSGSDTYTTPISQANDPIDANSPTATVEISATNLNDTTNTSAVTITFSEAVTGFDNSDVTVVGGTLSTLTTADSGVTWTATFTATDDLEDTGSVTVFCEYSGVHRNLRASATRRSANLDTKNPTATV